MFCYDGETCAEHVRSAPYFATSNEPFRPGQLRGYTLFSDDAMESPFAGANFLFVPYCSSDGWLLDDLRLLSDTFYVRGAVILQSILSEVLSGIEYRNATTLVLAGSSAGALGVVNHLAYVTNTLGFPAANVMMILDSWSAPLPLFETSEVCLNFRGVLAACRMHPNAFLCVDGGSGAPRSIPLDCQFFCCRVVEAIPVPGVSRLSGRARIRTQRYQDARHHLFVRSCVVLLLCGTCVTSKPSKSRSDGNIVCSTSRCRE